MAETPRRVRARASREGLLEYLVVVALLALAAAGAAAVFGDRIRELFGARPPSRAAAPAAPATPAPAAR
jgi:pilus assembly protein Flp/PilA